MKSPSCWSANPVDNELIPVEADVESDVIELLADDTPSTTN